MRKQPDTKWLGCRQSGRRELAPADDAGGAGGQALGLWRGGGLLLVARHHLGQPPQRDARRGVDVVVRRPPRALACKVANESGWIKPYS